jgi:hypothetical protein
LLICILCDGVVRYKGRVLVLLCALELVLVGVLAIITSMPVGKFKWGRLAIITSMPVGKFIDFRFVGVVWMVSNGTSVF